MNSEEYKKFKEMQDDLLERCDEIAGIECELHGGKCGIFGWIPDSGEFYGAYAGDDSVVAFWTGGDGYEIPLTWLTMPNEEIRDIFKDKYVIDPEYEPREDCTEGWIPNEDWKLKYGNYGS